MTVVDETVWLSYFEAGKRVGRDERSIRRWRREGMPMVLIDGQRFVDEVILLGWWRDRLTASPVEHYRRRQRARDAGLPDPAPPVSLTTPRARSHTPAESAPQDAGVFVPLPPLRGGSEYARLVTALEENTASCDGLDVFTRDRFDDVDELRMMAEICRYCPVLAQCRGFAQASQPPSGFWAGRSWATFTRKRERLQSLA